MAANISTGIFYFLAGLGVLLFGVSFMSGALEKVAGAGVRKAINKFSKNRFQSFALGLGATFLLQSSTASSIMFVGFAASGILTLFQAISMIIGSNVGTTLTAVLLSFKSINAVEILSVLVLVGVVIKIIFKNSKAKEIGSVLIGLGLLFAGMLLIDGATAIFTQFEGFAEFLQSITNPLLLILIGIVITILTQSSFGTIAILISIAGVGATAFNIMSLQSMAFVIYGANIGTCATALIVSLGGNADGKRVALFHILFNVIGTILFSIFEIFNWTQLLAGLEPSLAIILINIIFNCVTAILMLPFAKVGAKIMSKLFGKRQSDKKTFVLSNSDYEIPTLAIKNINQAMIKSFDNLNMFVEDFKIYTSNITSSDYQLLSNRLTDLSTYNLSVKDSVVKISSKVTEHDGKNLSVLLEVIQNYERVVHNMGEVLDSTIIDGKPIDFTKTQLETICILADEVINISNAFKQIYSNIFNENYNFDFSELANAVMQCTSFITDIKNNQKKKMLARLERTNNKQKYASFLNITNQFDEIGNDFNDMNVNLAEIFIKGEAAQ